MDLWADERRHLKAETGAATVMVMRDRMKDPIGRIIGARVELKVVGRGTVRDIVSLKPELQVMVKLDTGGTVKVAWEACTLTGSNILQKGKK